MAVFVAHYRKPNQFPYYIVLRIFFRHARFTLSRDLNENVLQPRR